MSRMKQRCLLVLAACAIMLAVLGGSPARAANPPICPYIIDFSPDIGAWAQGAPWIKVHYSFNIAAAKATGAKVFYRSWDADATYHDDGNLPADRTGSQYADMVWAKISGLSPKPDAVAYRNEFNWDNPTASKRTCAEFVNYANRLRALGYRGKIIFGSFGVGWVDSNIWNDPDLKNAVNAADGIETHEYFDLTVDCCAPWLAFRHRDVAIANHPYLQSKEWYIGEFGSDRVCGHCTSCDDYPRCRSGWRDNDKLTEQAYINQMSIYRAGCANQVVAVFVFQIGSPGWAAFEVFGTSVATWMKTTWNAPTGTISGTVKDTAGKGLVGATVTAEPGGYSAISGPGGAYTITNVTVGTYEVTAKCPGYGQQKQTGKLVAAGKTTIVNFVLTPITPICTAKCLPNGSSGLLSGIVTAQFPVSGPQERIYIESPDRSAGIAVATPTAVSVGDEVQVSGSLGVADGERILNASSLVVTKPGMSVPKPEGMTNLSLGGGAFGQQSAVLNECPDRFACGPNNIGLLVRIWGRVSYVDPSGSYFYVDDGSEIDDCSGHKGVRVASQGLPLPSYGT
ncbi:MAG: carboxypeptidase regulatory-like domain-containing protein, partial [Armatimonadota bacterium]